MIIVLAFDRQCSDLVVRSSLGCCEDIIGGPNLSEAPIFSDEPTDCITAVSSVSHYLSWKARGSTYTWVIELYDSLCIYRMEYYRKKRCRLLPFLRERYLYTARIVNSHILLAMIFVNTRNIYTMSISVATRLRSSPNYNHKALFDLNGSIHKASLRMTSAPPLSPPYTRLYVRAKTNM